MNITNPEQNQPVAAAPRAAEGRGDIPTDAVIPAPSEGKPSFPTGTHNAWYFATFNALSFQIVLGSPMILYAKTLGASATILGIIAGMMPLLVMLQIPAASHVNRVGYKRFVYAGWGTRVLFIFGMALVPMTATFLNEGNRLALLLALLFCFNLSRGISSCAWLPWITALVPPALRGKFLVRDAAVQNLASFVVFLFCAVSLGAQPGSWRFAMLFAFSAIMGATSLTFLKRIPDVEIPEHLRTSRTRIPWMEILRYPPFWKLLRVAVGWAVAYGGMTVFTVAFLKSAAGLAEGKILLVSSTAYLGGLSSLWFLGSRLDRLGSKPVIAFSFAMWVVILAGWLALAGRAVPTHLYAIVGLQFLMGLFAALIGMASQRLVMAVVPVQGRNHFFALYSVIVNLALGLSPVLWGVVIDAVGAHEFTLLGLVWGKFSIFFSGAALVLIATSLLVRRLEETEAAGMDDLLKEILIESPQRVWLRLWPRE